MYGFLGNSLEITLIGWLNSLLGNSLGNGLGMLAYSIASLVGDTFNHRLPGNTRE